MLSDRDALLAAIRANPEEDTPRLMFADWLDEQGDEASATRAEFIRLQCELAQLADDGGESQPLYEFLRDRDYVTGPSADWTRIDDGVHRRIALAMRAEDLFRRHSAAWIPKLPEEDEVAWAVIRRDRGREESSCFRRGFAHRLVLRNTRNLKEVAGRLREAVPAVTLVSDNFTRAFVEELGDAGLLDWISGLDLVGECDAGLREFGRRRAAAGVRTIRVNQKYNDRHVRAVTETRHWTGLQTLDLSETLTSPGAAEAIFRAKNFHTLKRLDISGNAWPDSTIRILASGVLSGLVSLRLAGCGLGDGAAELLANSPLLANLRTLALPDNDIAGRGVTALLASPHLANVAFLDVERNPASGLDAKRLSEATPGALRMFHAHGCRLRTADVRALARCPRLRTLRYLDLDDNGLGTAAVRELVRGFGKWCPPILWLTHNRIDNRGAELLAKWKAAAHLRVLHLKHNDGLTDAGVRALLNSPNLANLEGLGVSGAGKRSEARFKFQIDYP